MGLVTGSLHVRRSILCKASPARVWQEFETFEQISTWLNLGHELHEFEPRVGGTVKMSVEMNGKRRHYGGRVLVYEPEREVSFDSQWEAPYSWPVPTFWTIRLAP
ncbi:MAG: SRPBCC domain-containing protein, partial [Myxococcota bacterium]